MRTEGGAATGADASSSPRHAVLDARAGRVWVAPHGAVGSGESSATPLQQASVHLGDALAAARTDARTLETFLDIAIVRLAAEAAKQLERERRAA
jgi:hypothetical protein